MRRIYLRCPDCEAGVRLDTGRRCGTCRGRGGTWLSVDSGAGVRIGPPQETGGPRLEITFRIGDDLRQAARICGQRGRELAVYVLDESDERLYSAFREKGERLIDLEDRLRRYALALDRILQRALTGKGP